MIPPPATYWDKVLNFIEPHNSLPCSISSHNFKLEGENKLFLQFFFIAFLNLL